MLISTRGRYALRVLIDLAEHQSEGYVPLSRIAARHEISEKYLEAILKSLVRDKLLEGSRGKGGGYKLLLPPEQVTVGRILRLTEPALGTVSCLLPNAEECPRCNECRTLPLWKELDAMLLNFLDSRSLADLMRNEKEAAQAR